MGEFILGLMIYRSLLGSNVTWDQANIVRTFIFIKKISFLI